MFARRRPRFLRGPALDRAVVAETASTRRLRLRPHRLDDADAWFEFENHPDIRRHLGWPERTRRQSRQHLLHRTRHVRLAQADDFLALAVERDGVLVGDVSLHLRAVQPGSRTVEVGWMVHPDHGGRGIATEAADALLSLAFERVRAHIAVAVISIENERSIALARRLGFERAGTGAGEVTYHLTAERWRERLEDEAIQRTQELRFA